MTASIWKITRTRPFSADGTAGKPNRCWQERRYECRRDWLGGLSMRRVRQGRRRIARLLCRKRWLFQQKISFGLAICVMSDKISRNLYPKRKFRLKTAERLAELKQQEK